MLRVVCQRETSWCLIQMSNSWPFISHNSHFILHTLCPFLSFSFSALTSSLFFWWVLFLFLCLTKFNRFLFFFLIVSFVWFRFPSSAFYFARVISCTVGGTPWIWKSSQTLPLPTTKCLFSFKIIYWIRAA